jgi:hypothetical protein
MIISGTMLCSVLAGRDASAETKCAAVKSRVSFVDQTM